MALRCARCLTNQMVLETFGVFRCPSCGRVDADGKRLDSAALPLPVLRVIADLPPSVPAREAQQRDPSM